MNKYGGIAAAALLVALAGCAEGGGDGETGGFLDSTEIVCDEFAAHAKAGMPKDSRAGVVESIGEVIGNADQKVQDAYKGLANNVDGSDSGYQLAADAFAQACFDWGWDG